MADISKIKTLDGTTYNIKDATARSSIPAAATTAPKMDGTAAVGSSAKYAKEDHVHPVDTSRAAANHTHNYAGSSSAGGPASSLAVGATYSAPQNAIVTVNPAAAIQSPIPKYLWHDVWAFCRVCTPTFYTTTNGSTWTTGTLKKRLFTHQENWGEQAIINSTYSGARWVWGSGGFAYSSVAWIVIGVTYKPSPAKFDIVLESSTGNDDSATWTTLANVSGVNVSQQPVWIKCNGPAGENNMRLTIKRNSTSASTTELSICSLRLLSYRWGNQGQGSEYENPYQWNGTPDIYPILNNTQSLGTSSYKWKDVQTTSLNGTTIPASPKFTDTTYSSLAAASGGTDVSLVTTGEKYTWNNKGVIVVDFGTISSLPQTRPSSGSSSFITTDHVVTHYEIGNPAALASSLNVTTSNGSVTVTGSIRSGMSTTLKLVLDLPAATVT